MYIKIKHIKYSILFIFCLLLISSNYSNFVNADSKAITTDTVNYPSTNETDEFADSLANYVSSKGNGSITTTDIQDFAASYVDKNTTPITIDQLPDFDHSKIKILKQDYQNLDEKDKKKKLKDDSSKYLSSVSYLLLSNSPSTITSKDELNSFGKSFMDHLSSLSSSATLSDVSYFQEIQKRLNVATDQLNDIQVPETMVDLHVKLVRILKGMDSIKATSVTNDDPIATMVMFGQIKNYSELISDFMGNDLSTYLSNIDSEGSSTSTAATVTSTATSTTTSTATKTTTSTDNNSQSSTNSTK